MSFTTKDGPDCNMGPMQDAEDLGLRHLWWWTLWSIILNIRRFEHDLKRGCVGIALMNSSLKWTDLLSGPGMSAVVQYIHQLETPCYPTPSVGDWSFLKLSDYGRMSWNPAERDIERYISYIEHQADVVLQISQHILLLIDLPVIFTPTSLSTWSLHWALLF